MGSRSRKRRRASGEAAAGRPEAPAEARDQLPPRRPAPIGARKPTENTSPAAPDQLKRENASPAAPDQLKRGYSRGRERDEAIRASLEPLAPGERPRILTIASIVAFVFAVGNSAAALSGNDISSPSGDPTMLSILTTALLLVAGAGMLARQYWAVLGFQTILGIQIVFFSLYLVGVQEIRQAIISLVAIGLLGWLFWKLVRVMARLQMPERRPTQQGR